MCGEEAKREQPITTTRSVRTKRTSRAPFRAMRNVRARDGLKQRDHLELLVDIEHRCDDGKPASVRINQH